MKDMAQMISGPMDDPTLISRMKDAVRFRGFEGGVELMLEDMSDGDRLRIASKIMDTLPKKEREHVMAQWFAGKRPNIVKGTMH